jgi:hypothetical protein
MKSQIMHFRTDYQAAHLRPRKSKQVGRKASIDASLPERKQAPSLHVVWTMVNIH